MGIIDAAVGPLSKRDTTLPYTYEAWVDILGGEGREPIYDHYFADTICGLVELLETKEIVPAEVRLFGVYRRRLIPLETDVVTDHDGDWLERPALCHALEEHYASPREERYRGHVEHGHCAFEDRDRRGSGPVW